MKKFYFLFCAALLMSAPLFSQLTEPQYSLGEDNSAQACLVVEQAVTSVYEGDIIIPDSADYYDPEYPTVPIHLAVKKIGASAFQYASKVTSVSLPHTIESIGTYAFANCANLTRMYYYGTKEELEAITLFTDCFDFQSTLGVKFFVLKDQFTTIKDYMGDYGLLGYFKLGVAPIGEGEVVVMPIQTELGEPKVELRWFLVEEVDGEYTLEVNEEDTPKWEYIFDPAGELLSKVDKIRRRLPAAVLETTKSIKTGTATIGPLTPGVSYNYTLKGKTKNGSTTMAKKGKFKVQATQQEGVFDVEEEEEAHDIPTAIVNLQTADGKTEKIIINGMLYIRRGNRMYNALGQIAD